MQFAGTGSGTFGNSTSRFQTLNKIDSGTWALFNPLTAITGLATVIVSAGKLILQDSNTGFSGSTIVNPGATLEGNAIAIPGSTTVGATSLTNNGILSFIDSGAGSYSGVIKGSGNVEMNGSGILSLTNANTYSGQTTISSGGTLALANSGSIANSSLVTNNGTFDLQQKTINTNLGGNYVQTSTGNLKMGFTPSNVEKLMIAGTASLSGGLYVNAAPGHYNAGRYTLITTAPAGRSGTFTSFTTDFDTALSKYRLTYDGNNVYLQLDSDFTEVDNANTVQSVQMNAAGLANIYNQQVAAYQSALTYDCRVYDKNNLCVSVGGRYTYAGPSPSANQ